jgi:hypothetical protein
LKKLKETTKWIIYWSDELQRKIAHNKLTGERVSEEVVNKDGSIKEVRIKYTHREFRLIGEPNMNIHLLKLIFDGTIVDGKGKRD